MSREADVVKALVEMSDTLVDDFDVVDVLTALTHRCVSVLDVSAAGVMLASPHGDLHVVAWSSESVRRLELYELQTQQGPCLDAFRTGELIQQSDLVAGSAPWPLLADAATDAGFHSVIAAPLRLRDRTIGALNMFRVERIPMPEADRIVARAFADLATVSVLQHRAVAEAQRLNEQLSQALNSRIVIEQAKGVIGERLGIDMDTAFTVLRRYARDNNRRLTEVAQSAIEGTLDTSTLIAGSPADS
jgi:GAF domain-containing protein